MAHRKKPKQAQILKELEKTPIMSAACKRAGLARSTMYRWMNEDEEFAEEVHNAMDIGADLVNDMAESQVINGIKEGKQGYVTFWLKHNHAKYKPRTSRHSRKSILERQPMKTLVEFIGGDPDEKN